MPIQETEAKLWFKTREEEQRYDDKMLSNIELKSEDYDDRNFSPVFTRSTQEVFLSNSQKFKESVDRLRGLKNSLTVDDYLDRFHTHKPNHTYYRAFTIDKFFFGMFLGYFVIREVPIKNFYARAILPMTWFISKLSDFTDHRVPFFFRNHRPLPMTYDRWHHDGLRCYDAVYEAVSFTCLPNTTNSISESKKWYASQPAHLRWGTFTCASTIFGALDETRTIGWDGTTNMPLLRLADPAHKDANVIRWQLS